MSRTGADTVPPLSAPLLVSWLGFALGVLFGAVANRSRFCTMGAVSDVVNMGDWRRMRMWLLAIAVAILGANALHILGLFDLSRSIYPRPKLNWLSHLVGGALFGVGMTLASGCGNRTLVRVGGGSLKALVVLIVLGVSASMTLRGVFGVFRVRVLDSVAIDFGARGQDLPALLAAPGLRWLLALVIAGLLFVFVFKDRDFRAAPDYVFGGLVVGALVAAGWYVTGHLGFGEDPNTLEETFFGTNSKAAESLSFVAPIAYLLELLTLWSDRSLSVTFGIAASLGVTVGSASYALATKQFRFETFTSVPDTWRHILGALLMGFGGVTAMGCTIGQGISGVSTLALGSFITLAAIVAGAALTMKYLYWRVDAADPAPGSLQTLTVPRPRN